MRGRKPKSIELQIAEGDPRKHGVGKLEEKQKAQLKATPGLPDCPRHLKGRARHAWVFWSAELVGMKLDKRPDAMKLEGACVAYARAVDADLILEREGLTVKETYVEPESKEVIILKVKKHPAVDISNRAWLTVRAFGSDFGFDPVSRLRLSMDKQPDESSDRRAAMLKALTQPRAKAEPMTTVN